MAQSASSSDERRATVALLLLRDQGFSRASYYGEYVDRAMEFIERMRDGLMVHRGMAAEALEMLPPFPGRVWWTARAADLPSVGGEFELPQFHRVSTDMPAALNAPQSGEGELNVVWSVDRSSARDISPVARVAGERVVLYPAATRFRVASVSRGRRYDESTGRYFVHVTLAEVAPQGSERRGSEREWDPEILTVPARTGDGRDVGVMSFDARSGRAMRNALAGLTDVTHGGGFTMMVQGGPHGFEVVSRFGPRLVSGRDWGAYLGNLLAERGLPAGTRIYAVERTSAVLGQAVADASGHGFTAPVRIDGAVGAPRLLVADFEPRDRPVTDVTLREAHPAYTPIAGQFRNFYANPTWWARSQLYEGGLGRILAADPEVLGAARHMLEILLPEGAQEPDVDGADLWRLMAAVTRAAAASGLAATGPPQTLDRASPLYQTLRRERGFLLAERRSHIGRDLLEAYGERVPVDRLPLARRAVLGWLLSTGGDSLYEVLWDTHRVAGGSPAERAVLLGDAVQLYAWAHAEFAVAPLLTPYQDQYEQAHRRLAALASDTARAEFATRALPSSRADEPAPARRRRDAVRDWLRRIPGRLSTQSRGSGTPESAFTRREVLRDVIRPHGVTFSPLDSLTDGHLTALYLFSLDPDRGLLAAGLVERFGIGAMARHSLQRRILRTAVTDSIRQAVSTTRAGGRSDIPLLLASDEQFGGLIDRLGTIHQLTEPYRGEWLEAVENDLRRHFDGMEVQLLDHISEHVAMAAEALRSLPPINASMWLTHQSPHADVDAFRIPAFSKGALNRREAMASLSEQAASSGHRLLVEVVNSSAREVSFLSPMSDRTIAMYADRGMELVVQQRGWRHDADGNRYEYVQVTEAEPVGPFPARVRTTHDVGADELPSAELWNAPVVVGQPAEVDEMAQSPGGAVPPALPVPHQQDGPGANPPQYPSLYNDPSWAAVTAQHETALGRVLAADPTVILEAQQAVRALYEYLALPGRYSQVAAASAFFTPGRLEIISDPVAELNTLVAKDAATDVRDLMSMFAWAAHHNPLGITLSNLWSKRPELYTRRLSLISRVAQRFMRGMRPWRRPVASTHQLPLVPRQVRPYSPQEHEEHLARGLRLTQGPAEEAEWLLGVYRALGRTEDLLFREVLLGWLLESGEQSLVEVLRASHRAGVRDELEPDLSDASQLYGWAQGVLDPKGRLADEALNQTALREALDLPHHRLYKRQTWWIAPAIAEHGDVIGDIRALIRGVDPVRSGEMVPGPVAEELSRRREALRDWLRHHRLIDLLKENVNEGYLHALYLVSGSDAGLLDPALEADAGTAGQRLRDVARSLVRAAMETDAPRTALPLLFLRDESFRDHLPPSGVAPTPMEVAWLEQRAEELTQGLRGMLRLHQKMAAEALEVLPPFPGRVSWATSVVRRPSVGDEFGLPQFHRVSTDIPAALNAPLGGRSRRAFNVVWSVDRTSARDISPLARVAGERVVLYPAATRFRVASVSSGLRYDESTGAYFVDVVLTEADTEQSSEQSSEPSADRWSTGILTWPIKGADGRDLGVFGLNARDRREFGEHFRRSDSITSWHVIDADSTLVGPPRSMSWDGDWFVAGAHAGSAGVMVASRYGPRLVDGSHWGAYLKNILKGRQLPPGTRIFSYACKSAVHGQAIADASEHDVTAPTGRIGTADVVGMGEVITHRMLRGGEMPRMVDFVPRDRGVGEAEVRAGDRAYAPYAGRFRAYYKDSSWAELAQDYERDLGEVLAEDPEVLGAARHMLETLLPEEAKALVPEESEAPTLAELMTAATEAAVRGGLITVREQPFDRDGDRYRVLHETRGFHLAEGRGNIARGLLDAYRDRVPAARVAMARRAVLGWLLSAGADSLYEAVTDTWAAGASLLERVVLLGDAAHLYAWAHAEFAAGTELRTPYQ
ncbi:hypothetical protein, partial [Streptomyces sp. NPDC060022]|uniref:hypothetical protein n=1 Tax=Streptomyces sp. NPDC060022 TaxID=3347039 RepID=UPI0036C99BE0